MKIKHERNREKIKEVATRFCEDYCRWKLRTRGYVIAWTGVIYRIVAILVVAVQISRSEEENLWKTMLSVMLAYCFVTLAAELLLIVGISKARHYYLLPYLSFHGLEILTAAALFIGGIFFFIKYNTPDTLSFYVPSGVVLLGLYVYFWLCLCQLLKYFENLSKDTLSRAESQDSVDFASVCCSLNCFKSDSLDIVT